MDNSIILPVEQHQFLLKIFFEKRNSFRLATGKRCINMRVPFLRSKALMPSYLSQTKRWLLDIKSANSPLFHSLALREYKNNHKLLRSDSSEYTIKYESPFDSNTYKARMVENTIHLSMDPSLDIATKNEIVPALISKLLIQRYSHEFRSRILQINEDWNNSVIQQIRFKHNTSNWGSCSAKKNLNFSSRLFLLPDYVQEYVIVHELAHLIHQDHSRRFWNLVASRLPDYGQTEFWIKQHGLLYDF